ncbi:MAG: type II secretion system protein GspN [Proteobacteria bacterium]|nr:type II secretion system protein GspN [Pseudomonadota bacterium]MBU1231708.1 type II secretion system protein GspN [Pseudomonadota bacterium]
MNFFRNKVILFFSLILYTLLLTATLLYIRFPAEKLKISCQYRLEQLLPRTHCSIGQLSYRFPFSLVAKKLQISSSVGEGTPLITIDQASITPVLASPKSRFLVTLSACGGNHDFTLILNRTDHEFSLKDIRITELDLSKLPFLHQATAREIIGSLEGNGTYHGIWKNDKYETEGHGTITLSKGSFSLLYPILSLKKIDLKKLETDITFQGGNLKFEKGTFNGQELKGNFSGSLGLNSGLGTSTLSFQGNLDPLPPLLKTSKHAKNMVILLKKRHNRNGLPFRLDGIVQKPIFSFDS